MGFFGLRDQNCIFVQIPPPVHELQSNIVDIDMSQVWEKKPKTNMQCLAVAGLVRVFAYAQAALLWRHLGHRLQRGVAPSHEELGVATHLDGVQPLAYGLSASAAVPLYVGVLHQQVGNPIEAQKRQLSD